MNHSKLSSGVFSVGGVAVLGVGVVLHIVGLATTHWTEATFGSAEATLVSAEATLVSEKYSFGIWKTCVLDACRSTIALLESLNEPPEDGYGRQTTVRHPDLTPRIDTLKAVEAFAILGMVSSLVALTVAAGRVVLPRMNVSTTYLYPVISLAASTTSLVFILVAANLWALKFHTFFATVSSCGDPCTRAYSSAEQVCRENNIGYSYILSLVAGILISIGGYLGFLDRKQDSHS